MRFPAGCALSLAMLSAVASPAGNDLVVREIGSFYVGGQSVSLRSSPERSRIQRTDVPPEKVDPNGDFEVGQIYVQYVRLARPRNPLPLILLPGGSVTGVTYETTPDGRPGWQLIFLHHGYSIYVADTSQAGRAPWARFPELNPAEPLFRTKQFLWQVFRLGPEGSYAEAGGPRSYEDTRFPVRAFAEFAKQVMPRFRIARDLERSAYDALIGRVCPCLLLAHSAAGPFALEAAQRHAALIAGVIVVEPSAAASLAPEDLVLAKSVPHLFLWGDHLELSQSDSSWAQQYFEAKRYHEALVANRGSSTWIYLPDLGIRGNSHMLMMDDNSEDIAARIHAWIQETRASKVARRGPRSRRS
jgi:pimeloyl-ACP methyl ester carboxylesterase